MPSHRWMGLGTAEMSESQAQGWADVDGVAEADLAVMFTQVVCVTCDIPFVDAIDECPGPDQDRGSLPHRWISLMTVPMTDDEAASWAEPDTDLRLAIRPRSTNLYCALCGQAHDHADGRCPERWFWVKGSGYDRPREEATTVDQWNTVLADLFPRGIELQITARGSREGPSLSFRVPGFIVADVRDGIPHVRVWPLGPEEPIALRPESIEAVFGEGVLDEDDRNHYVIRAHRGPGEAVACLVHFQMESMWHPGAPDGVFWRASTGSVVSCLLPDFKMGDGSRSAPEWLLSRQGEADEIRSLFVSLGERGGGVDRWEMYDLVDTDPARFLEGLRALHERRA